MAYASITKPSLHFNTVTYTGNGSTQSITGVGFQPDWVWLKGRNVAAGGNLSDSVRGVNKQLQSAGTFAEETLSTCLTSFDSDGFALGSNGNVNGNTNTYVAWNWYTGATASANGNGSISSSVSVNTTAGFSIVSWTGTGANATVGHGLGVAPKWYFVKNRTDVENWIVYHASNTTAPETDYLQLDNTTATGDSAGVWNDTAPTTTTFSVGTANSTNGSGDNMIAYCFSEIKGFSKFGEYKGGNANADGPFVYLGFKPAFVLVHDSDNAENWLMYDNERPGRNLTNNHLFANTNDQETASTANTMDLLSNGFKVRSTNNGLNRSGGTFLYMAFAEHPFVSSTGTPVTAR